jgi:Tetracyclin repressor-like, C-terminal domain
VERTIEVLHQAGFGLADASRAAASFIWFVVGRTVEEQTLPGPAAIERLARTNPGPGEKVVLAVPEVCGCHDRFPLRFAAASRYEPICCYLRRPPRRHRV